MPLTLLPSRASTGSRPSTPPALSWAHRAMSGGEFGSGCPPRPRANGRPVAGSGGCRSANNATSASNARTDSAARRPSRRASSFSSTTASATSPVTPASVERLVQLGVRDERDPAAQLDLGARGQLLGDCLVLLDSGEEGGAERRDQHGAGQRGADRRRRGTSRCSAARLPRRSARRGPPTRSRCPAARPGPRSPARRAASAR